MVAGQPYPESRDRSLLVTIRKISTRRVGNNHLGVAKNGPDDREIHVCMYDNSV